MPMAYGGWNAKEARVATILWAANCVFGKVIAEKVRIWKARASDKIIMIPGIPNLKKIPTSFMYDLRLHNLKSSKVGKHW